MANNKVKHYRTNVAGRKPDPAKLEEGEIAINMADKHIFTKVGTKIVNIGNGADATVEGGQIFKGDVKANKLSTDTDIVSKNEVSSKISFVDEHDKEKVSIVSDAQTDGAGNLKITVQDGKATDRSSTFVFNGNGTLNLPAAPVKAENATRKDYVDAQIKKTADKSSSDLKTNVDTLNKKIDANDLKQSDALTAIDTTINAKIDANDLKQSNALTASDASLNKKIDANDAKQTKALSDSDKVLTDKINANDTKQDTNLKTNVDTLNKKIDANDLKQSNALTASDAALNKRIDEVNNGQTGAVNTKVSKAGDTMTGDLSITRTGTSTLNLNGAKIFANSASMFIVSTPNQTIHFRPNGPNATEGQMYLSADGSLSADTIQHRGAQGGNATSVTRKDYVDSEVKKSVDLANAAKTDAANVLGTAKAAETKATNAENVANTANATANTANTTAKTALDTANAAKTAATSANTNAESRVKRAGDTMTGELRAPTFRATSASFYSVGDGNSHLWFQKNDGTEKSVIYAQANGQLNIRTNVGRPVDFRFVDAMIQVAANTTGSDKAFIRGTPDGGSHTTWRDRSSGLQIDCPNSHTSAYNVWKATKWGSNHLAGMDVHAAGDDMNNVTTRLMNGNHIHLFNGPTFSAPGDVNAGNNLRAATHVYSGGGASYLRNDGQIGGSIWEGGLISTHIENRAAAHAQNGINRANEVNNRISNECITAFRLGGIQQGWGGNGAHDVTAGWVVTGMDKGQSGSTGNGTIQLRCKCIQVHIPNRGWVNAVDLWGQA